MPFLLQDPYRILAISRLRLILISSFLLLPSLLSAQYFPHLSFQKFYDHTGEDYARRLLKSRDGHLILGGNTVLDSDTKDCANLWFLKVDTLGEILWQLEVPRKGCEELKDMIITDDNGLLFTGITNGQIRHEEKGDRTYWADAFVGKLDAYGRLEWIRNYGGSRFDQALALSQGDYDEYMVVGGTHSRDGDLSQNLGMSDLWTLKIDGRGNIQQSTTMGGKGSEWGQSISRCANGDLLIAGLSSSQDFIQSNNANSREHGFLIRIRSNGTLVWNRHFACPLGGYFASVQECPDGRLLLTGNYIQPKTGRDFWFLRLTSEGKLIQEEVTASPNDQWWLQTDICPDSGYVFGGYSRHQAKSEAYAKGGEDFWVMRTNSRGELLWKDTFGGPANEKCVDIVAYSPGVFYALGEKQNLFKDGNQTYDYWLVRIDEKREEEIKAEIYVRAENNRINRDTPTRFRARCAYGERFLWDFGDGTTSTEKNPLKSYRLSGLYDVTLTVFINENCKQTVGLGQELEVW